MSKDLYICENADECKSKLCFHRKSHELTNQCKNYCGHSDYVKKYIKCTVLIKPIEFLNEDEMKI